FREVQDPHMKPQEYREAAEQAVQLARQYATPRGDHVSLGGPLRAVVFLVVWALGLGLSALLGWLVAGIAGLSVSLLIGGIFWILVAFWASRLVRVAAQWERGVVLRFGRFHAVKGPGLLLIFPIADSVRFVDTRLLTLDIPHQ